MFKVFFATPRTTGGCTKSDPMGAQASLPAPVDDHRELEQCLRCAWIIRSLKIEDSKT